jgi:hypothetical protein
VPLDGPPLLALRLTTTVLLAHLSYEYVEEPIRRGALGRAWSKLRQARGLRRKELRSRWLGAFTFILTVCATLAVAVVQAEPPHQPSYLSSMKAVHTAKEVPPPPTTAEDRGATSDKLENTPKAGDKSDDKNGGEAVEEASNAEAGFEKADARGRALAGEPAFTGSVSAIGDSVMLGAVGSLHKDIDGLTVVDAEVGMQVYYAIGILKARRASGQLGEVVVVHLGNNGIFTEKEFDEIMQTLSGVDRVVFVNVKVPRAWERPNNEVISAGVQRYPNAMLVDWYSASVNRPELFYSDGFHLRPRSQRMYADLISSQLTGP